MYEYANRPKRIALYFVVAGISFILGWQMTYLFDLNPLPFNESEGEGEILEEEVNLALFWDVWETVEEKYVHEEKLDREKMVHGAIKGMVESLDDSYTVFMTPEESKEFADSLAGTLEGIGAELTVEKNNLVIVSPLRNSPAEKAGLMPGDIVYQVDGEPTIDMTLFEAVTKIRGEKGTTVTLTIIRDSAPEPFDVSLVRNSIDLDSVTAEEIPGDIVYLSVNQFNDKTLDQFSTEISEMLLNEPKGLIIDLRYNGGGYLDIAVELLSFLLPSNTEAVIIEARDVEDEIMYTDGNPKLLNVPLIVLVNEGSASASEIMAGAIQDHERGVIMGTQTFGKGTVQEVIDFADASSMRITIAKWLTPNKQDVNEVGLTPDIVVEITEDDVTNQYDRQKEEAIKYLKERSL